MPTRRIVWQRDDVPGHEWCELRLEAGSPRIVGSVVLAADGVPWRIAYEIDLDDAGRTRRVRLTAAGSALAPTMLDLTADGHGRWTRTESGEVVIDDPDALDADLGFSPSTNTLPIRRLGLALGEGREIAVCWVLFPSFEIVLGRQVYERLDEQRWRYRSKGFEAELTVDADGLVEDYAVWRRVAEATIQDE